MPRTNALLVALVTSLLVGCSGDGPTGTGNELDPPATDLTGSWQITSQDDATKCGEGVSTDVFVANVTQDGNDLTVRTPAGTFDGRITGRTVSWSGSYPDDGGTTTIASMTLTVSKDGNELDGVSTWSWSDGVEECDGTSEISATRQ